MEYSKKLFLLTCFLFSLVFLLFLGIRNPVKASCIPASDNIGQNCSLTETQHISCENIYYDIGSATCDPGDSELEGHLSTVYECNCLFDQYSYECTTTPFFRKLIGYKSARMDVSTNACLYPGNYNPVNGERIINQSDCKDWCRPAAPPPTPVCDSTCGVCGVRLGDGSCYVDWGNAVYKLNCCHMACVGCSCQYVVGGGAYACGAACCTPTPIPPTPTTPPSTPTPILSTPTPTPTPPYVCKSLSTVGSFIYRNSALPWWQTKGGNIYSSGTITSSIPECAVPDYLSLDGDGGSPGVVFWNSGDLELSEGLVSSTDWQAKSSGQISGQNYTYLLNRFQVDTSADTFNGEMPSDSGTYYSSTAKDLTGSFPTPAGKKIIIFVNGNVTVKDNIVVDSDGFFALIAKGNISFSGSNPNVVRNAQGFFLADGTIEILPTTGNNRNFEGQGSFVGLTGISLDRNLGLVKQNCAPAEIFIERPDFYINAPSEFQITTTFFREVAP